MSRDPGSIRVAVRTAPTCGCSEDRRSVPGSSSLMTVTVTGCATVFAPSEARTVTEYSLFPPASAGDSKSGIVTKRSRPLLKTKRP